MKYLEDSNNIISLDKYSGKYIPPKECSVRGRGCFENIVNILLSNIYPMLVKIEVAGSY